LTPKRQNRYKTCQTIIIGGGYNGYGLIRSLGEVGIFPILISGQKMSPAKYSRFISRSWIISGSGQPNRENRKKILSKLSQLNRSSFLIPTDEAWVVEFLDYGNEYKKYGADFPILSPNATRLCLSKDEFALWCNKKGILVPESIAYVFGTNWVDFLRRVSGLSYPVVIKPKTKGVGDVELGFNYYTIFYDHKSLLSWSKKFGIKGPKTTIIAQEFIPGSVKNLISLQGYINKKGRTWASQYVKLRQTQNELGCTQIAVVLNCNSGILKLTEEILLDKLEFQGFFDIEFKQNEINKKFYLIEINPRPGMLNYAATMMGVNLPLIAIKDICMINYELPPFKAFNNQEWIWTRLLDDFFFELKNTVSLKIFSPIIFIRRWYRPYKNRKVIDPLWTVKDLKPGLAIIIYWTLEAFNRLFCWINTRHN
jgi:predicted ATP-grasp superfamily ATP-dependent carboligase